MVFEDIEIPQFSDLKPAVVDAAVRKNPAKWKERNKRRAQSRKNAKNPPTWEVQQVAKPPEVEGPKKEIDLKAKVSDVKPTKAQEPEERVEESVEDETTASRRRQGKTMPGGYYVRSLDEVHKQTMRAFNVRLTKPYQRVVPSEEEELPPLEPETAEAEKEEAEASSRLPSRAARLAEQRLRQSQEVLREEQKRRQEEETERRREADRRRQRRLLEAKICKLREEQEVQEQVRREAEKQKQMEEAILQAAREARRKAEKQGNKEKEDAQRLRRQRDAEEDAMLREERRRRRQQEEAARKEQEEARLRQEEERTKREKEKEQEEKKRQEEEEAKRAEEERIREAERLRLAKEQEALQRKAEQERAAAETEEEARRREEIEKEERRKRAEQRRKEIKEKAERARKAHAAGLPPSAAAAAAAEALKREAAPAEVQITVAVLGHQGSGKSTLVGALLLATGTISERDLVKRRKDLERFPCEEIQREDGLRTPSGAELSLLDVPGGRRCLPQAVQAAAEADVALLVVSAKGREMEAALREASGTSALAEQLRVAKGLGANRLLVAVTKMDDAQWAQDRFDEVTAALTPVLTNAGFNQAAAVFVPVDGLSNQLDARKATWHTSGGLLQCLDEGAQTHEPRSGELQVLLFESFAASAKGLRVRGRVEQGLLQPGQSCRLVPHGSDACTIEVLQTATRQPQPLQEAKSGRHVELQLTGSLPDWPNTAGATAPSWRGAVLCSETEPVQVSDYLKAQMEVIEMPRPLTAGFKAVLHVHAATVEAEIEKILEAFDWATGVTSEKPKVVKAGQRLTVMLRLSREVPLCVSPGSRLGMVMLRLEETTVAIGHVMEVK
ncbi:unnamed protein product [Durusdinium trenchii]|uniref:Uncharacterized protein n=2 Tax=Durusdinium trenchii TaxID=1381693 RepID=A0ABP0MDC2_9DINO